MKPKNTLKILDKVIELAKLLIELKSTKNVPIPDYRERKKGAIVNNNKGQETIVTPDGKVMIPIKKDNFFIVDSEGNKTQISPPYEFTHTLKQQANYKHDFHKGMIDAEKELQRVCKEITLKRKVYEEYECLRCGCDGIVKKID